MARNYVRPGMTKQITNTGAALASGAVKVVGQQLTVCLEDIAATTGTGEVSLEGVFTVAKVSGAVIADGEMVMWDASAAAFDDNAATPATGDVTNCAIADGAWGAGTTSMRINLANRLGVVA